MTKEEIKEHLKAGGTVRFECWTFREGSMGCDYDWDEDGYNCCFTMFDNIDEAVGMIEFHAGENFEDCTLEDF